MRIRLVKGRQYQLYIILFFPFKFQTDIFVFGETVKDYISLLTSIKVEVLLLPHHKFTNCIFVQGTFQLRVKAYGIWQAAQTTLAKKREYEVKLQTGGKPEKLAQAKVEIEEVSLIWFVHHGTITQLQWEKKVEEGQKSFDSVSKVLKKEVKRFEVRLRQGWWATWMDSYSVVV